MSHQQDYASPCPTVSMPARRAMPCIRLTVRACYYIYEPVAPNHVQDPTGLDTIEAMNQILQPLDEVFRTRLADAKGTSEDARWVAAGTARERSRPN